MSSLASVLRFAKSSRPPVLNPQTSNLIIYDLPAPASCAGRAFGLYPSHTPIRGLIPALPVACRGLRPHWDERTTLGAPDMEDVALSLEGLDVLELHGGLLDELDRDLSGSADVGLGGERPDGDDGRDELMDWGDERAGSALPFGDMPFEFFASPRGGQWVPWSPGLEGFGMLFPDNADRDGAPGLPFSPSSSGEASAAAAAFTPGPFTTGLEDRSLQSTLANTTVAEVSTLPSSTRCRSPLTPIGPRVGRKERSWSRQAQQQAGTDYQHHVRVSLPLLVRVLLVDESLTDEKAAAQVLQEVSE